ncbi:MAG TPA: MFS transporter [Patescibacteria group bacterium]|nr:MFS transporter [Patescibacteria group bacterium]
MNIRKRFPAFFYRDFRLLWGGQLLSLTGTQMQMVALNWQIYEITHSAVALGLIGLFRFLPIAIFSLLAGSISDVHNRKYILYFTQTIQAAFAILLGVLSIFHSINAPLIFIITILSSIAFTFDMPARQALTPNLVDREHLTNAMSLNSIMWEVSAIGGPALGGLAIAAIGVGNIYLLNALSYIAIIGALIFMYHPGHVEGPTEPVSFAAIWEGLVFVKSKTIIWSTMLLDFFSTFFASATSLIPVFAKDILHVGPQGLGFLYAAPSIGAVLAALAVAHIGHIKKPGKVLLISITFYAVGTILFGISKDFIWSFFALFLVGGGDSVSAILRNTIRQLATPDYIRGRMTSVNMIFFMGGPQLGDFEAGILAAAVGGPLSVVIGGIGTLIAIGFVTYCIPTIRNYKHEITSAVVE